MYRLKQFVTRFVEENFTPIAADADISVETWLSQCGSYSAARKLELLTLWNSNNRTIDRTRDFINKLFEKDEDYADAYKHARGINSRSDAFKCFSGPFFKLMEHEVYKHPAFIKHIPQRRRPKYIVDMLGKYPGPWMETDYSQFEKHFVPQVLHSIEFVLYKHMLKNFPGVASVICGALAGENVCRNKYFTIKVLGRRMSGDMCTSLGNGFSNLMLAKYIAYLKGGEIEGVVEGDDGLFFASVPITPEDFANLGFTIKMLYHDDLLRTSFCGLVMSRDLSTMTDPFRTVLGFGWTHSPQMNGGPLVLQGLLKAKALSLAYEHPSCPILSVLATTVLGVVGDVKPRFEQGWYAHHLNREIAMFKEETAELLAKGPSDETRRDFAAHYGVPVHIQKLVENEIAGWSGGPLQGPWLSFFSQRLKEDSRHYYRNYVFSGGGKRVF